MLFADKSFCADTVRCRCPIGSIARGCAEPVAAANKTGRETSSSRAHEAKDDGVARLVLVALVELKSVVNARRGKHAVGGVFDVQDSCLVSTMPWSVSLQNHKRTRTGGSLCDC
jgi:hypothetical protein